MTNKARRRRRRKSALFADRVIADVKRKEREFLREASRILSEAIGFPVRVSRVKLEAKTNAPMRKARRMTKAQAKQQVSDAFAPVIDMTPTPTEARAISDAITSVPKERRAKPKKAKVKKGPLDDEMPDFLRRV